MRKKHKIYHSPTVKIEPLPKAFVTSVSLSNLQEQKNRFLKHGKTPIFVVQGDSSTVEELAARSSGRIRFDLLGEAEYILRTVKQNYGVGENYLEHIYGPRIEQNEANQILFDYIRENSLQESLAVYWSNEMPCSARMIWKGYSFKCNRPEARRYSLWLNGTAENPYLRRHGLRCLLDHEIGTHFYRSYNDGFQPWFYDRKKFGLRGVGSFESLCTEEGLAAINTTLRAKEKYLWLSALTYYTACKSTEMTFRQLFDHLGQFVQNPEQRWKHVMRVKRGLIDPNDLGGYGKDQCYFEGAVTILRNIDDINFNLLMSGKICFDEVSRVKRLARLGSVSLPAIMRNMESYRKQLKEMAVLNGLYLSHPTFEPPSAYLLRLKERQAGTRKRRKVRKGRKLRASLSKVSCPESESSKNSLHSSNQSQKSEDFADCSSQNQNEYSSKKQVSSKENKTLILDAKEKIVDKDTTSSEPTSSKGISYSKSDQEVVCHNGDDLPKGVLVSDSNGCPGENHTQGPSHGTVAQNRSLFSGKKRPHTAGEFRKGRLSCMREGSTRQSNNSNAKDNPHFIKGKDGSSVSSPVSDKFCTIDEDSFSISQLSVDEEDKSWFTSPLPSSPSISPFSEEYTDSALPPIIPRQTTRTVTPHCICNLSYADPTLCICHFPTASPNFLPPPFCIKGKKSGNSISHSMVAHEQAIKSSFSAAHPGDAIQNK